MIRGVRPTDLPRLDALYRSVRAEIGCETTRGFLADTAGEEIFVLTCDEEVCGFAAVYREEAFLHHLYLAASVRGRGYGVQLLEAAAAGSKGLWLKVEAANRGARAFYLREGFTEEPEQDGVVVMRRGMEEDVSR